MIQVSPRMIVLKIPDEFVAAPAPGSAGTGMSQPPRSLSTVTATCESLSGRFSDSNVSAAFKKKTGVLTVKVGYSTVCT